MNKLARPSGPAPALASLPRQKRGRIPHWIRPLILDLGCCGPLALQVGAPGYGLPGFAGEGFDLQPEEANVLVVAGRITPAFAPALRELYNRLHRPRHVIAFGTCAVAGTIFDTVPASELLPVHVVVDGCPPSPEDLASALSEMQR
jgi:NADH:ubiquinone oxidoreductase subunit B-like Fe-S oxidoreductase